MLYRELLPLLIGHSVARFMEKKTEEAQSIMVPPRRKKYNLVIPVGKIFLPHEAKKLLNKLSLLYGIKEVEVAELILQAVLNSIPIVEMASSEQMRPEDMVELIADSMVFDKKVHATEDTIARRKVKKDRESIVETINEFIGNKS